MKKQRLNSKSGYTLLEVMLAVSIAMIIAAWGVINIHNLVLKQKGQAGALGLYKEIQALPALARKFDTPFYIQFSHNNYQVYKETDGNPGLNTTQDSLVSSFEKAEIITDIPSDASSPPPELPFDNVDGIAGNWDNTITFSNDHLSTITDSGAVYIQNTALPKFGYCIGIAKNSRVIKIYTWAGGTWNEY